MRTIKHTHKVAPFISKIVEQYLGNMRMGVFDIETLGLNGDKEPLVLAGLMTVDRDGNATMVQYFAERLSDEVTIIENLRKDFEEIDFLFTYNGKHFDLPFLAKRAKVIGLDPFDYNFYNLDLYLVLNGYSQIKHQLKSLRQKTVEKYMGISQSRDDLISGADSIELYNAYINCSSPEEKESLLQSIMLHNHDDILQLYKLLPVLKQVDIHKAFNYLGFPLKGCDGWPDLNVSRVRIGSKELVITGKYLGNPFSYLSYNTMLNYYTCEFDTQGNFSFAFPLDRHKGNSFINLKNYFKDYEELKKYPHYMNNFLLLAKGPQYSYLEANKFTQKFLRMFMETTPFPQR